MTIPNKYWDCVDNITGMKGSEKFVLNFLCRKANSNKNYSSWYSVSEMARMCCLSKMSIKNATKTLSSMGLITKQRRKDTSSVYILNLERIEQLGKDSISLDKKEEGESLSLENTQYITDGENICPSQRQLLSEGGTNTIYKNVNENVIENAIYTGVCKQVTHSKKLSEEVNSFWQVIHDHVRESYKEKNLPQKPSFKDVEAIEWAIDEMLSHKASNTECRMLCSFVDEELGMPQSVFNPIVRLRDAYQAHEWPEQRFIEQFEEFRMAG